MLSLPGVPIMVAGFPTQRMGSIVAIAPGSDAVVPVSHTLDVSNNAVAVTTIPNTEDVEDK